jgi:D-glycero-D-manno-heptose 1,7-bisphosphate phosphatase
MKRPAVFIDRDGTINEEMGYINHPSRFILLPGVAEAIKLLNTGGFLAVVLSNQSGVARGYFPVELVHEIHLRLERSLREQGAIIDGIFFCPHHPEGTVKDYAMECHCRKPRTGLLDEACNRLPIDLDASFVIGDRYVDMELAYRAGLPGIMVKTGYGLGEVEHILPGKIRKPVYIAANLLDGVRWMIDHKGGTLAGKGS